MSSEKIVAKRTNFHESFVGSEIKPPSERSTDWDSMTSRYSSMIFWWTTPDPEAPLTQRHMGLAGSVQKATARSCYALPATGRDNPDRESLVSASR